MSTLRDCLYGQMPLRPKKNFLKENVKQLRNLQKKNEENKKSEPEMRRGFKEVNITRVNGVRKAQVYLASSESSSSSGSSSRSGSDEIRQVPAHCSCSMRTSKTKNTTTSVNKCTSPQPPKELKHQAVQTALNSSEINEGTVRYPSGQLRGAGEEVNSKCRSETSQARRANNRGDSQSDYAIKFPDGDLNKMDTLQSKPIDYVKQNATIHFKEKASQMKIDPTRAPPNYRKGVVPKYLQGIKSERKSENEKVTTNSDCPPGHVQMSDYDRLEHLRIIRQQYADLVQQLNNLPVRSDSYKVRTRKMEIEKELDKLEKGIKLFSMEKLYVKVA